MSTKPLMTGLKMYVTYLRRSPEVRGQTDTSTNHMRKGSFIEGRIGSYWVVTYFPELSVMLQCYVNAVLCAFCIIEIEYRRKYVFYDSDLISNKKVRGAWRKYKIVHLQDARNIPAIQLNKNPIR